MEEKVIDGKGVLVDRYGRTGEEFLEELFEFNYCEECGGDVQDHDAVVFLGNWFARCQKET